MSFDIDELNRQSGIATTTINSTDYTLHLLPTTIGLTMALDISKLLMPSVGAGVDGLRHDDIIHGSPKTFSELASLLVKQMGDVDIVRMVSLLLKDVEVAGSKINFEMHFRSNYGTLIQLIEFALKENFESFFTASGFQDKIMKMVTSLTAQPAELDESLEK